MKKINMLTNLSKAKKVLAIAIAVLTSLIAVITMTEDTIKDIKNPEPIKTDSVEIITDTTKA